MPGDTLSVDVPAVDTPVGVACTTDAECGRCARCDGVCRIEPVVDLFLGHRSTCYTGLGGARWCTGDNGYGQLGLGDLVSRATPERADDGEGWDRIWLFYFGDVLASRQGQFWKWGMNVLVPTAIGASRDVRAVLGDLERTCFWEVDGTAPTCPGAGTTVWHSLDYGAGHYCGVRESDRTLWCWGDNWTSAVGVLSVEGALFSSPLQVGTDTGWEQVGTGGKNAGADYTGSTCALKQTGQIYCFGHTSLIGTDGGPTTEIPTQVTTATDYTWIDVDWEHACAGKADGSVRCWGTDTYGGFVAPGLPSALFPVEIPGTYDRWIMGGHHACGLTGGRWRCMGWNDDGQLGVGTTGGNGDLVDLCP